MERQKIQPINFESETISVNTDNIKPVKVNKHNMKETKELLSFVFSLIYATSKAREDGKFDPRDIFHYTGAVRKAPAAVGGLEQIPEELKDLTAEELTELKTFIIEEFNLVSEEQEVNVERLVTMTIDFALAVLEFKV